jgi:20S proteasome alpha/beta subunit
MTHGSLRPFVLLRRCSFRIVMIRVAVLLTFTLQSSYAIESLDGRFSFSLSTFHPSGKLGQVERAMIASSLGTPIVAVIKGDRIVLASPQILPSPFMKDDGTTRFSPITQHIAMAHSGISADGRVLVAAAQQLAVEHAYTYDENIPIDLFLEELSLLFQEYTMTPGVRPFGAIVLIAHTPAGGERPQLFRIDPSGSVMSYGLDQPVAMINANFATARAGLETSLRELGKRENTTVVEDQAELSRIIEEALLSPKERTTVVSNRDGGSVDPTIGLPSAILLACLTRDAGLQVERRTLTSSSGGGSR